MSRARRFLVALAATALLVGAAPATALAGVMDTGYASYGVMEFP